MHAAGRGLRRKAESGWSECMRRGAARRTRDLHGRRARRDRLQLALPPAVVGADVHAGGWWVRAKGRPRACGGQRPHSPFLHPVHHRRAVLLDKV